MKKSILTLSSILFFAVSALAQPEVELIFDKNIQNVFLLDDGFVIYDIQERTLSFSNGSKDDLTEITKGVYFDRLSIQKFGDKLFLIETSDNENNLWICDGTKAGTRKLYSFTKLIGNETKPSYITTLGNRLLFSADDLIHGREMWTTDGTPEGTFMLKDIYEGGKSSFVLEYPNTFKYTKFKDKLYFNANDSIHGTELWVTDGTEAGTHLLKDIYEGEGNGSFRPSFFIMNDNLFFTAVDSVHGFELWKTDGTENGTQLLKDINPGKEDFNFRNSFSLATNNSLSNKYVFLSNYNDEGEKLWVTDGTANGTHLLKDIRPEEKLDVTFMTVFNDKLYFTVRTATSETSLWRTDGTDDGTIKLMELGTGYFYPIFHIIDNKLFFIHDKKLWLTDGTASGTKLFKEGVNKIIPFKDRIYFTERANRNAPYSFYELDTDNGNTSLLGELPSTGDDNDFLLTEAADDYLILLAVKDLDAALYAHYFVALFDQATNSIYNYDFSEIYNKDFDIWGLRYNPYFTFNNYFYFNIYGYKRDDTPYHSIIDEFSAFCRIKVGDSNITHADIPINPHKFTLYPNPAHSEIHLTDISDSFEYAIINMQGQTYIRGKDSKRINIRNLTPGIYFLRINENNKTYYARFIKQ